jgi:hypothetical protein
MGASVDRVNELRIPARKLGATLEPLFALGKSPHRSNRQKVKSTRAFVGETAGARRDVPARNTLAPRLVPAG